MARTFAHLHLPKFKRRDRACVSVKTGNLPVRYIDQLLMADVKFVVRPAGRRKFKETGVRNVHAGLIAARIGLDAQASLDAEYGAGRQPWRQAHYRPQADFDTFVDSNTLEPVTRARFAFINGCVVSYIP